MLQDEVFAGGQADRYFERNAARLAEHPEDWPLHMLSLLEAPGYDRVLDVGCANGWRLDAVRSRYGGSRWVGVEPSEAAVREGLQRYSGLDLRVGGIAELPVTESFDLVMVAYIFCWVDRAQLARAVAEVDRVTRDGGFLLLADFHPGATYKRAYHHAAGMFTYKMDYAAVFQSLQTYQVLAQVGYSCRQVSLFRAQVCEPDDRFVCTLLRKSLSERFPLQS